MKKYTLLVLLLGIVVAIIALALTPKSVDAPAYGFIFRNPAELARRYKENAQLQASASATPSPRPLTFEEMNKHYGPCAWVPTIFYHHIEDLDQAKAEGHLGLAVGPDIFKAQMQYLADHGYHPIAMQDLINFFDAGAGLPAKPILITIDDGYDDFALNGAPILQQFNFKATMFLPTGLVGNPGYLTWDQVSAIAGGGNILFANHTWSHRNTQSAAEIVKTEITTADSQLTGKGLGNPKVFAYPYGIVSNYAINLLNQLGYKLGFDTIPGSTLCKAQRMTLPRVRIGNVNLSAYGF